jgi:hypothetical protein
MRHGTDGIEGFSGIQYNRMNRSPRQSIPLEMENER